MELWAIQATVTSGVRDTKGNVWSGTRQIPTFYLNPVVQGIENETQAIIVARDVLDNLGHYAENGVDLNISAVLVPIDSDQPKLPDPLTMWEIRLLWPPEDKHYHKLSDWTMRQVVDQILDNTQIKAIKTYRAATDESLLYCKDVIYALRVLVAPHLYENPSGWKTSVPGSSKFPEEPECVICHGNCTFHADEDYYGSYEDTDYNFSSEPPF